MTKQINWYYGCVVILLLFLLGACGQKESYDMDDTDIQSEQIVIKWMLYGGEFKDSDKVFDEFNRQLAAYYPDTKVEFEVVDKEAYKEKWDMTMVTNEPLDIAWIGQDIFNYSDEVKKGSFMALDYLLSTYGQDILESIPSELWELQVRGGNTFSIPLDGYLVRKPMSIVTKETNMINFPQAEQLKTQLASNPYTGPEIYETLDVFFDYVNEIDAIGTGISHSSMVAIADRGLEGIYGPESPFVIKIFDDTLKVYNKYELDSYRMLFEMTDKWYREGYIREDIDQVINPTSEDGKNGGSVIFLDIYESMAVDGESIYTDYEPVYLPLENYRYIPYDSCRNAMVIPKSSENPERAMEILTLLLSKEGETLYRLLVNGFESEHYIVLEDESIVRMRDNDDQLLYGLSPYSVGNIYMNFQRYEDEHKAIAGQNDLAINSKLNGFSIDTRMIAEDLTKTDLVVEAYIDALSQGNTGDWEKTYIDLIVKMHEADTNDIIEEVQRQIDEFVIHKN